MVQALGVYMTDFLKFAQSESRNIKKLNLHKNAKHFSNLE